jgi:hypothetical protein
LSRIIETANEDIAFVERLLNEAWKFKKRELSASIRIIVDLKRAFKVKNG